MALRRRKDGDGDSEQVLTVDASMTGTLAFKDPVNLQINGQFEGTLDTKGTLTIGEGAHVKATIQGEQILVAGSVEGNLTATGRVELAGTARFTGKLTAPRLIVHDGAVLSGPVEIGRGAVSGWLDAAELARYLEVDVETVLQWAQDGRLPSQREGNQWRFERAKIEDWLAQERIK
ncbi:MAG TPA: polymer-forming cytoskeletal protein [bacterium]